MSDQFTLTIRRTQGAEPVVKEITAYQADDGTVHPTAFAAALHDGKSRLKKLGIFNEATINSVIEHRTEIYAALHWVITEEPSTFAEQLADPATSETR